MTLPCLVITKKLLVSSCTMSFKVHFCNILHNILFSELEKVLPTEVEDFSTCKRYSRDEFRHYLTAIVTARGLF